jgi:hypothetical protein
VWCLIRTFRQEWDCGIRGDNFVIFSIFNRFFFFISRISSFPPFPFEVGIFVFWIFREAFSFVEFRFYKGSSGELFFSSRDSL